MPNALIALDSTESSASVAKLLRSEDFVVEMCQSVDDARRLMLQSMPDLVIIDEQLGGASSLGLLKELSIGNVTEIYVISDQPNLRSASRAMRAGVADYFEQPVDMDRLRRNIGEFKEYLDCGDGDGEVNRTGRGKIVGDSAAINRLFRNIRRVAPTEASVLIVGESGVGKELVATTIHELSNRSHGDFVAVNCSAIPKDLIESEIFGHKKGSFTGATSDHRGYFQLARGGSLLLDEITEMDAALQAKLLRVLEVNSIRPVGSEKEIGIDVRILASTNREPDEALADGSLREDLFYRLSQFPIRVPPRRARRDDIDRLVEHFLSAQNNEQGLEKTISDAALSELRERDWPGNVRELRNVIIQSYLVAGDTIELAHLPDSSPPGVVRDDTNSIRVVAGAPVSEVERRHILSTLEHFEGDKKRTAKALGISLKTLYNRLHDYGM